MAHRNSPPSSRTTRASSSARSPHRTSGRFTAAVPGRAGSPSSASSPPRVRRSPRSSPSAASASSASSTGSSGASREELEASLRGRPDDATLAVYADVLQAQGDPRGELIALELTPPQMSTNGIEVRRGQLLAKWLGDDVDLQFDREQQLWYAGD